LLLKKNLPVYVELGNIFLNKTTPGNSYDAPLYLEEGWIYSEWETKIVLVKNFVFAG